MLKPTISSTQFAELTIKIPVDLEKQAGRLALQHGETMSEFICLALASYLDMNFYPPAMEKNEQVRIDDARTLMREFGRGLGEGQAPHDGARQHDLYTSH